MVGTNIKRLNLRELGEHVSDGKDEVFAPCRKRVHV